MESMRRSVKNWEVADDLFMILYGSLISNGRDYDI
jgi:hypothetical protein